MMHLKKHWPKCQKNIQGKKSSNNLKKNSDFNVSTTNCFLSFFGRIQHIKKKLVLENIYLTWRKFYSSVWCNYFDANICFCSFTLCSYHVNIIRKHANKLTNKNLKSKNKLESIGLTILWNRILNSH